MMTSDPDEVEDLLDEIEEREIDPWPADREPCSDWDRRMDLIRAAVEKLKD